jgi:RHH-type proline utilization regulon transcriptional repressor/proline dehydrogenase/delta 1-pyrroline-5-carboxylate dehydrogenase
MATAQNSAGIDLLGEGRARERQAAALAKVDGETLTSGPLIGGKLKAGRRRSRRDRRPTTTASSAWSPRPSCRDRRRPSTPPPAPRLGTLGRRGPAPVLRAMADALEADMDRLIAILSREAGKTLNDGIAEVREAVDFCRYYAMLAERSVRRRARC